MKKMILTALVAVASLAANAQVWVGGEVGFSATKTSFDGNKEGAAARFNFLPEIGYTLINPYVRYKFAKTGDFTFFVDGGFSYTMIHYSNTSLATYDDNANQWALGFKPGISYSLTDKVSLVAHVGDLGYAFYKWGDQKSNTFDMGISNNISFGAYVSF